MTADEIFKWIFGVLSTCLAAVVAWLAGSTIKNREQLISQAGKIERLEADIVALKASQITEDCVREVIDEALEKRDKLAEQRRGEWHRLNILETGEKVREELNKLIPRLLEELDRSRTHANVRKA